MSRQALPCIFLTLDSYLNCSILKMEEACTFETSVGFRLTTRRYFPREKWGVITALSAPDAAPMYSSASRRLSESWLPETSLSL